MVKDELRKLLNQPYKSENWKKITEFVFPNVSYLQKPQDIPIDNEFQGIAESFKQLGFVKLNDGKNLALFEVHVTDKVNLSSNRVQLRKLVANKIDKDRNHGVLVIYEQGKEDYRFTFTAKSTEFDESEGDFKDVETDAKRFTYILGKNESCKTAANRFWELSSNKDKATIKDVEQAFSVERLNKEFFEKYKSFYEDFVQHITGKRFEKEKGKWIEITKGKAIAEHKLVFNSDDKLARNFVKLLLGRLVFIQFLQKKGWMGVPADSKKWKNGDKDFINNLFIACKKKDKFHSDVLHDLFYKAFNTPNRPNDVFGLTGTRVPYLNGGLFENEYVKTELINFPSIYFQDLFDFFGQYNFTIDENDPMDHEVGIDPEMLGHIFENLLEDNKDKGAFYTPKPIVQYMCQESLIQYLKTYLVEHKLWSNDEKKANKLFEGIQNFVRKKTASEIIDFDEQIATALRNVKICDPAIGSGAFPMGLLNEIFYCMNVLYNASPDVVGEVWEMSSWQADIVKKNIIQHSIYGVDLEKGAVDIARLRFWLSLIVDEKEPYPLPNLDFKIMQGNSLLESFEGIDLSNISGQRTEIMEVEKDLFGNPINSQSSIFDTKYIDESNITELIEEYFNAQKPERKQELKKDIDTIIHNHIDFNLGFEEIKIQKIVSDLEFKVAANKINKSDTKGVAEKKEKVSVKLQSELKKEKDRLKNLQQKRKELHDLQNTAERPYFLWHLFFKDIFDKGGFDIVIGNPPYKIIYDLELKDALTKEYKTFKRNNDIYVAFYEKGVNILKRSGALTYITPNTFRNGDYFEELRSLLSGETLVVEITDYKNYPVFNDPTVFVSILICIRERSSKPYQYVIYENKGKSLNNLERNEGVIIPKSSNQFKVADPIADKVEALKGVDTIDNLFYVKDIGFNYWSEGGGKSREGDSIGKRVFYDGKKRNNSDIPFIKGKDIHPFKVGVPDNYLIHNYQTKLNENDTFRFSEEFLLAKPKLIYRQTANTPIAAIDTNQYFNDKTVHVIVPKKEFKHLSLYYLCGLLNSSLFAYLYTYYSQEEKGRAFSQVKTTYIKKLPFPKEMPFKDELESLVKEIMKVDLTSERYKSLLVEINEIVFKVFLLADKDKEFIIRALNN